MEGKITTLKKESHQAMIRKFGREIDIDNLEEVVLRNIISKVRFDLQEEKLKREFESKISNLKVTLYILVIYLCVVDIHIALVSKS